MESRKIYELLKDIYSFEDAERIIEFLSLNQDLIDVLLEADKYIDKIFGQVHKHLELHWDPEEDYQCMFIVIETDLPVDVAMDKLDRFDEEYWLNVKDEVSDKLEVIVKF